MGVVSMGATVAPYFYAPIHLYTPRLPIHLYVLPTPCVPNMSWDMGDICTPHMSLGLLGASVYLSGISVSVSATICLSVHNSHTSCSPSLWVASLLDWVPMDVCYASCCCSFLCSFHYVLNFYHHSYNYFYSSSDCFVFWYIISSLNGYHGPLLDGASSNINQHDMVLLPLLTPRHPGGVVGLTTVLQQESPPQMPLQDYANNAKGPP